MLNNRFPCHGYLQEIRYFRGNPDSYAYVGIWRQLSEDVFILKHQIPLPPQPIGIYRVPVRPALEFEPGDFLGVHYDRDARSGVIVSSVPEDGTIPQSQMFQTQNMALYNGDVRPNEPVGLARFRPTLQRRTYALQAIVADHPDGEGEDIIGEGGR